MNESATSLDRLHDIVESPPVPWWPPAPGWYFVLVLAAGAVAWFGFRYWKQWRAKAYRRAALRELQAATTPTEIAELFRRTALAIAPRTQVASLSGDRWAEWLASLVPETMPRPVHDFLATSVYDPTTQNADFAVIRGYAKTWIERHRGPQAAHR